MDNNTAYRRNRSLVFALMEYLDLYLEGPPPTPCTSIHIGDLAAVYTLLEKAVATVKHHGDKK